MNARVDEINDAQDNALNTLRAKIEARKKEFEAEVSVPFPSAVRAIQAVPEVTLPNEAEFQLDRYTELMFKIESLFNNYLVYLLSLREDLTDQTKQENFESALKELCRAQEEFMREGMKPRF